MHVGINWRLNPQDRNWYLTVCACGISMSRTRLKLSMAIGDRTAGKWSFNFNKHLENGKKIKLPRELVSITNSIFAHAYWLDGSVILEDYSASLQNQIVSFNCQKLNLVMGSYKTSVSMLINLDNRISRVVHQLKDTQIGVNFFSTTSFKWIFLQRSVIFWTVK